MKTVLAMAAAAALACGVSAAAANPFSDVSTSDRAYQAVADLSDQGVAEGCPDGTFRGTASITRYEMAQITAPPGEAGSVQRGAARCGGPAGGGVCGRYVDPVPELCILSHGSRKGTLRGPFSMPEISLELGGVREHLRGSKSGS